MYKVSIGYGNTAFNLLTAKLLYNEIVVYNQLMKLHFLIQTYDQNSI